MDSTFRVRYRSGFTLIETIVTVALLAVLAAFIIPTVIQKVGAGDPVKVQNDLNAIQTGLETFATDSKAGFPHQISTLTNRPVVGTTRLIDSTKMSLNQVAAWNGPYIGATITTLTSDKMATGFTASLMNFLDRYDIVANTPEHDAAGAEGSRQVRTPPTASLRSGYVADIQNVLVRYDEISGVPEWCSSIGTQMVPCTGFITTNPLFVAVRIDSLNLAQALIVNGIIDGPNETQPGLQGRFRFPTPASPTALATPAYFLASPVP